MNTNKGTQSLLSLFLTLFMLCTVLPTGVFAEKGTLTGSGLSDDPYLIEDAADLEKFRDMVNDEESSTLCAKLVSDIDLSGKEWTPFNPKSGYVTQAYAGIFDGDFHSVTGLIINSEASNQGLFGVINGATVKNLKVVGSVSSSGNYVGGIAGKVQQGTIENCSFSGSVATAKSGGYAGGITGYAGNSDTQTAQITGCVSTASVSGSDKGIVGGIVGYAKYSEIINCYNAGSVNGAKRSGGIAGQLQNNCSAKKCYNIGTVSGSDTASDICDFLYKSAALENCYYATQNFGAGEGSAKNCCKILTADTLLENLGSAFASDLNKINDGYPVLSWQNAAVSIPKEPRITIGGNTKLTMSNNNVAPQTTLTVQYIDMDDTPELEWSVTQGADVISIEMPENAAASSNAAIVKANRPGKATILVSACDGLYTAQCEISVLPFITTVSFDGTAAVGETVCAKVNVLGGGEYDYENYPELCIQWKYLTEEDYVSGNTGSDSYTSINGATDREFLISEELAGCYLSFSVEFDGALKTPGSPKKVISAAEAVLVSDKAALSVDTADVRENKTISLPTKGEKGSDITWESNNVNVINPQTGAVVMPQNDTAEIILTAALTYGGETVFKEFKITVYSVAVVEEESANKRLQLEKAALSLGDDYRLYPVFGTDTNVLEMVRADLEAKQYDDITVSIKSIDQIYGGASIDKDGTISYYYVDPNTYPTIKMGSYKVNFILARDGAEFVFEAPVIVYWDIEKVKTAMKTEILDKVSVDTDAQVSESFDLPKVVDGKTWTQISWTSSDESIISISTEKQQTADTLFDPFVAVVKQGAESETVTLTATFTFQLTNDVTGNEAPVTMNKVFVVNVKALDQDQTQAIRDELEEKLNIGLETVGLTDAVTGELLTSDADGHITALNDIQFPTTADFDVDGKLYPISIESSNANAVKAPDVNNAARAEVLRPAVGQGDAQTEVTVSIKDKDTNISVSKTFNITVPALTQEEVDSEKALMEKVKAAYFDGIKGQNNDRDDISKNLSSFLEVYEEDGELVWVRDSKSMKKSGIVPVPMSGWQELEAWRLFRSSNPAVISHENLLVTLQNNAKAVSVCSALSSEALGKYGELYQSDPVTYAAYSELADLYYQEVSAELTVRGKNTASNSKPVAVSETIDVLFSLVGSTETLIKKVSYENLDETTTVFDIFKRALSENGYTYESIGTYVTSITTPDGTTVAEMSEGSYSGWMYKVNGKIPDVGMGAYGLNDGDNIVVFFTKDFMKEMDYVYYSGSSASSSGGSSKTDVSSKKEDENEDEDEVNGVDKTDGTVQRETTFTDVLGHWGEKAVLYVSGRGLMRGVGDSLFAPDDVLTRAMFVTIIYRLENEPEANAAVFTDVERGSWYENAVAWANENGIVSGVSDTEYAPDDYVTREQMAVMLYRYAQFKGYDISSDKTAEYSDFETVSEYAKEAVSWAFAKSVMSGNADGTFAPQAAATRAQAATVLMNMAEMLM